MHGCQATLSRTPFSDHLSLRALFPRLPAVESGSTEPIHCFTPIQNLVALALSGHTSSLTLLPLFLAPAVMSPCSPAREMPLCPFPQKSKKKRRKKSKLLNEELGIPMATRSCGIGRDIRPSPMPFAYKLPSWHLVVMTTAHSSQNSFGSEIQKESSQRGESLMKFFFFHNEDVAYTDTMLSCKSNHCIVPAGN